MPPRDVRMYLFDIRVACEAINGFVSGLTIEQCKESLLLRSAVERQFEIIGEALRQATRQDPSLTGSFPETRQIVGFRNQLVHGYHLIEHDVVWGIIEADLPGLGRCVEELLSGEGPR